MSTKPKTEAPPLPALPCSATIERMERMISGLDTMDFGSKDEIELILKLHKKYNPENY